METVLDLKDKKILFELEQDSRQSLSQLAKKVALKKETIFHRIKALEKEGIIKSYLTEINVYRLGYQYYPLLLRFQDTTPQIETNIFRFLKESNTVAWLTSCEGAWDANCTLIAKNHHEVQKFLDEFQHLFSRYIAEKQLFITAEIHYFKRGFWLEKKTLETVTAGGNERTEIDDEEMRLLKLLSSNARMPLVDMGKFLKMHPKNIAYRIEKLEKQGIIQGSRILVDFSKTGYRFYKVWFSLKEMDEENAMKLLAYFRQHPNILWATKLLGMYDLSIEMEVKDVEHFREIMDDIKQRFSNLMKRHESMLIFEESLMNYLP